ncbi:hypothetical protein PRNP1_008920 [Phytophthora ramorum]
MADGSTRADGAATGVTHASALALLADSSAASNKPGKSTVHTQEARSEVDSELGRVILKLEKARARVGASLTQIPTGREYDSPPDVSDEPTYDALEKAYNAAFLVHTPETVEHVHIEEPVVWQEEKLGVEDSVKLGGSAAEDAEKREGKEKDTTQVGTLKSICLSTLNQHTKNGAQSESQGTGVINGISARAATASPSQSPMSVPNRTSSEDGFLSTPEVKRGCRDVAMKPEDAEEGKVERADHISLKEFLVSELEVYCSRLVERKHPQNGSSDACDLAWITGLQLYQDHERALMDFDDEWKRSHANSYPGYANEGHEELQMSPLTIITNPFQQDTAGSAKSNVQEGSKDLYASYKRGSNGVVIGDSYHKERLKISEFMAQIASSQNTSAFYVVVAAGSDLAQWEKALLSNQLIQLYPYWGSKEDRQNLLQLLSNEYFSNHNLSAHVLLTSYEVFMEDISVVTSLQCQLSVIDIPQAADKITAIWPQLLSLRCRQRLLLCQPGFEIDARKLLHFLVPELFSSRRKLLAWSSAALHINQIRQVCDVVEAFTLISNSDASRAFISKVESCTKENCEREMAALDTLDKQGIVRAIEPSIMVPVRRVLNKKSRNRVNGHIPATGKLAAQSTLPDPVEPQLTIQAPNAKGGHDQYVDEMGNVVYSGLNDGTFPGFYEAPDASDRPESPESVGVSPKIESPSVIEACKLFVEPQLVFACKDCVARFSSKLLLDFHERVEHSLPTSQHVIAPTAFEREASLLFTRPICQNAMLCAQTNQLDRNPRSSPLGYAKLQSQQFQYFFMEPFVILGRMEARWCELYKHLGVANLKGLAGGDVNCHVGNDSMIATTHAVISWDARLGSFVIECLSLRTPISVNGREVSFSSPPATLSSRNLVQIGASVFYFLLPKTTKTI